MCKKAVNIFYAFLPALHEWFVRSKMIKTFHNALFIDNDILFYDQDSGNVTFSSDEMDILSVDLNNVNLDDAEFMKMIQKL